jgi:YD repeat-containing protein
VNLPSFNAKVKRDANGRVTLFDQAEDEEDDAMYRNTFTYDERGRLVKIERRMWESSETFMFTYEGDNIYPSTRRMEREEEGDEAESETTYRYTKFDSQGNWIERELRYRGNTKEGNDVTRWRGANIERRTIEYYPSH